MSLPVQTTLEADAQVREIDNWWRRNRGELAGYVSRRVRGGVRIDRRRTIDRASLPEVPSQGVRRVLLMRSRYHVYYVALDHEIRVLAVWHGRRGSGPPLRVE